MRNASILTTFSPETSYEELQSREEVARRGIVGFVEGGILASAGAALAKNLRKEERRGLETFVVGGLAAEEAKKLL